MYFYTARGDVYLTRGNQGGVCNMFNLKAFIQLKLSLFISIKPHWVYYNLYIYESNTCRYWLLKVITFTVVTSTTKMSIHVLGHYYWLRHHEIFKAHKLFCLSIYDLKKVMSHDRDSYISSYRLTPKTPIRGWGTKTPNMSKNCITSVICRVYIYNDIIFISPLGISTPY